MTIILMILAMACLLFAIVPYIVGRLAAAIARIVYRLMLNRRP